MGLIKENANNISWLNKYGFEYSSSCVATPSNRTRTRGYERGYEHEDGLEYLWVTVDFPHRKIYLYNEYDCGGLLWERELDIPDGIYSDDEYKFIEWLDGELDIE